MGDFTANDKLLLPVLKTFARYICSLHATWNVWCFQSVCSGSTVLLLTPTAVFSYLLQSTATCTTSNTPTFPRNYLLVCLLLLQCTWRVSAFPHFRYKCI